MPHGPIPQEVDQLWNEIASLKEELASIKNGELSPTCREQIRSFLFKQMSVPAVLLAVAGFAAGIFMEREANKKAIDDYQTRYKSIFDTISERASQAAIDAELAVGEIENSRLKALKASEEATSLQDSFGKKVDQLVKDENLVEELMSQVESRLSSQIATIANQQSIEVQKIGFRGGIPIPRAKGVGRWAGWIGYQDYYGRGTLHIGGVTGGGKNQTKSDKTRLIQLRGDEVIVVGKLAVHDRQGKTIWSKGG